MNKHDNTATGQEIHMQHDWNKRISERSAKLLSLAQCLGLGLLGVMTIIAMGHEMFGIIAKGTVGLGDLLLLFIYLEVLVMVRAQLVSGEIPLSMPFAIAIVALSRYLVLDLKNMDSWQLLAIASAMLLLALSLVALRYWKNAKKTPAVQNTAAQS